MDTNAKLILQKSSSQSNETSCSHEFQAEKTTVAKCCSRLPLPAVINGDREIAFDSLDLISDLLINSFAQMKTQKYCKRLLIVQTLYENKSSRLQSCSIILSISHGNLRLLSSMRCVVMHWRRSCF